MARPVSCATMLLALMVSVASAQTYTATDLGPDLIPFTLLPNGLMTGDMGSGGPVHAFRIANGVLTDLGQGVGNAINNRGVVAGMTGEAQAGRTATNDPLQPYAWTSQYGAPQSAMM
jgi:hypothetical protein